MLVSASFVGTTYVETNLFFLFPDSSLSVLDNATLYGYIHEACAYFRAQMCVSNRIFF